MSMAAAIVPWAMLPAMANVHPGVQRRPGVISSSRRCLFDEADAGGGASSTSGGLLHSFNPKGCCASAHRGRLYLLRNGRAFSENGAVFPPFSGRPTPSALSRRNLVFRATEQNSEGVEVEVVKSEAVVDDDGGGTGETDEDEELGIDKDGNLTASLPEEFLELMKDEGPPPNYWVLGFGLSALFLARKAIWAELKRWGNLAVLSGIMAMDVVVMAFVKLLNLGGQPLSSIIVGIACVGLTVNNIFRFIAAVIPPGPVLFSVILASVVLLVGESVSNTYSSTHNQFPSRNTLDIAGLLGLGGFVGLIPAEIMLLGLAAITVSLLLVRKVNPVAGFTPVAAVFAAVTEPIVRYPIMVSFIGSSLYRYWRLGYMSQGAVPNDRTSRYPRVLTGLLYLVGVSLAARTYFFIFDFVRAAISLARA